MSEIDSIEHKNLKPGRKRFKEVRECPAERTFREQSNKDLHYFTGEDQGWDDNGARARLKEEGRPAMTLNRVAPIIRLIQGARPQADARFTANEEGDVETADILNAVKDHVGSVNRWNFMESDWFRDGLVKSRAVVSIFPGYNKDIRGEIKLEVEDGHKFYFDPNAKRRDRSDGEFMFKVESLSPDKAKRMWPKSKGRIAELTMNADDDVSGHVSRQESKPDDYEDLRSDYYDSANNRLTIAYYWYKEYESVTKIIDLMDPANSVFESPKSKEEVEKELAEISDTPERFRVVSVEYVNVRFLVFCHDIILEEGDNPWNRDDGKRTLLGENFPYICFEPERIHAGSRQELISILNPLHDPQKFHNKLASAIIHIIGTSANAGWEYEKQAISRKEKQKLKKYGSKPGVNIEWEKDAIAGNRTRKIQPTMPPQSHMMQAKQMASDILDVSGVESLVSTESLGKGASGKAIDLKQRQGGNIIDWVFESFRFYQHVLTEYIRDAIQLLYDYEKVIRITGPNTRYVRINENVYDQMGAISEVLNDVTIGDYDVSIVDKEVLPTMRLERFREFVALVKEGALQLPPPVLTKIVMELMEDPQLKQIVEEEMSVFEQQMAQMQQQQAQAMGGQPQQAGMPGF
jgi:hypothetical protein